MAIAQKSTLSKEYFAKVPDDFFIMGICLKEGHGWTAILLDFDIPGAGDSPSEAMCDAIAALDEYLEICFDEDMEFEQALRPAPAHLYKKFKHALKKTVVVQKPRIEQKPRKVITEEPFRQPYAHCV